MSKIYKPEFVEDSIKMLGGNEGEEGEGNNVSYVEVFTSPKYRKATWVGIAMAAFQ